MEDDCKLRKTSSAGQAGVRRRNNAAMDANTAAWGYAKVAMLMFVALFIVWVSLLIFYSAIILSVLASHKF
jgi:hypothetical protein